MQKIYCIFFIFTSTVLTTNIYPYEDFVAGRLFKNLIVGSKYITIFACLFLHFLLIGTTMQSVSKLKRAH